MSFDFNERASDSPLVKKVWRAQSEQAGSFTSVANIHWEMVVRRHNDKTLFIIRGPETKASHFDFQAGPEWFGITFKPGAFMPTVPLGKILDHNNLYIPQATTRSFWLHSSLWQFPTYENADTFINRLQREGLLAYDPVVDAVLQGQRPSVSLRSLQYRFLQVMGMPYKTIEQITRAQRAMELLEQGASIHDTVFEAGYFDQPHLTRSLRHFTGHTPAQLTRVLQP